MARGRWPRQRGAGRLELTRPPNGAASKGADYSSAYKETAMNLVLLSPRVYRWSVIGCAVVWLGVGLLLSDIVNKLLARQPPSVLSLILCGLFVFNGVLSARDLIRAAERLTEPTPSTAPDA